MFCFINYTTNMQNLNSFLTKQPYVCLVYCNVRCELKEERGTFDGVRRVSGLRREPVVSVKNPTLISIPQWKRWSRPCRDRLRPSCCEFRAQNTRTCPVICPRRYFIAACQVNMPSQHLIFPALCSRLCGLSGPIKVVRFHWYDIFLLGR